MRTIEINYKNGKKAKIIFDGSTDDFVNGTSEIKSIKFGNANSDRMRLIERIITANEEDYLRFLTVDRVSKRVIEYFKNNKDLR